MYQHVFAKNDFQCLVDLILIYLIKYLISKQCHPPTHSHIHISTRLCTVHSENEMWSHFIHTYFKSCLKLCDTACKHELYGLHISFPTTHIWHVCERESQFRMLPQYHHTVGTYNTSLLGLHFIVILPYSLHRESYSVWLSVYSVTIVNVTLWTQKLMACMTHSLMCYRHTVDANNNALAGNQFQVLL